MKSIQIWAKEKKSLSIWTPNDEKKKIITSDSFVTEAHGIIYLYEVKFMIEQWDLDGHIGLCLQNKSLI